MNAIIEEQAKAFLKQFQEHLKSVLIEIREKNRKIRKSARRYNIRHSNLINKIKRKISELENLHL